MSSLDRVKFFAASSGTGDFVVASAVTGFQTPATSGMVDGTGVTYIAQNPSNATEWEYGQSIYRVSGTTLPRGSIRSSAGLLTACNFTSAPVVAIGPLAEGIPSGAIHSISAVNYIWDLFDRSD